MLASGSLGRSQLGPGRVASLPESLELLLHALPETLLLEQGGSLHHLRGEPFLLGVEFGAGLGPPTAELCLDFVQPRAALAHAGVDASQIPGESLGLRSTNLDQCRQSATRSRHGANPNLGPEGCPKDGGASDHRTPGT